MDLEAFPPIAEAPFGWARRRVIVTRKGQWWTARVPSLPGCVAHGRSRVEALERMQRALRVWVEGLEASGSPVPEDVDEVMLAHLRP